MRNRISYRDLSCETLVEIYARLGEAIDELAERDPSFRDLPEVLEISSAMDQILGLINMIDHPGVFVERGRVRRRGWRHRLGGGGADLHRFSSAR
ncbi:MAG: hypothetical protein N3G75_09255 [Methanothrix sp.]|nr:hypothetical protein [Methanothrix sp.]MCX8207994.1 hypothetical protein [Methanothrix sp.]